MLKTMRNSFQHLKWILVFVIFLFVLLIFVDWGAGGATGNAARESSFIATVDGEQINQTEFSRALAYAEQNFEQNYGQEMTPEMRRMMQFPQQVVNSLVEQKLLLKEARDLDLYATPEEVRKNILEIPALNPAGKFVGAELYERYVTSNFGYPSAAVFEEEVARGVTLAKLDSALENSVVISPKAVETEYRKQNENAKIRYILIPADVSAAGLSVSPAEVEAHYKQNVSKYAHGAQQKVRYFLADTARIRAGITIDEKTLRANYEASKESYKAGEMAKSQHILIKPADATPAADAAAQQKAASVLTRLRAGGDFAALARENSADPGSAANGGDLGYLGRNQTVGPFDQYLFSAPIGQLSDPIKTGFGYHIIKVVDRKAGGYKPFEEVRFQIEQQIAGERSKVQARDEIARIKNVLDGMKDKTDEALRKLANDKVTFNDSGWVAKGASIPELGQSPILTKWMEDAKDGELGEIADAPRGPMIPIFSGRREAGTTPLDEIRVQVETDAKQVKAREAARVKLADALPAGFDAAGVKLGVAPAEMTITRSSVPNFTGNVAPLTEAAMTSEIGVMKGPFVVDQGAVAIVAVEQKKFDQKAFDEQKLELAESLRKQEAQKLRRSLLLRLRKSADVRTNDALIASASGMAPGR